MNQKITNKKTTVFDFFLALILPAVVGKSLILYFGGQYSAYPGEGYGVGLILSITFTIIMVGRFLWRYRNHKDT